MKRSTFRKSSLISSVALLLVAIVALSGATFAWFSSNDSTKASGIQMTASAASGLYIAESAATTVDTVATDAWKGSINFGATLGSARPTSPDFTSMTAGKFITTTTDRADGVYVDAAVEDATADSDYIAKSFWVKGDASEKTTLQATVTIGGTSVKGYERVAIYDYTTGAWVGGSVLAKTDVASYKTLVKDAEGNAVEGAAIDPAAAGVIKVADNWDATAGRHFIVYCWFEGQDAACTNANSGADFNVEISFALV
ncbi:MAG: hypothetical protein IJ298_05330 [Ruminococcus sp.]|nr:hypothetical protein [Ruminococcus sp.]